jgi:hypothetical protein
MLSTYGVIKAGEETEGTAGGGRDGGEPQTQQNRVIGWGSGVNDKAQQSCQFMLLIVAGTLDIEDASMFYLSGGLNPRLLFGTFINSSCNLVK